MSEKSSTTQTLETSQNIVFDELIPKDFSSNDLAKTSGSSPPIKRTCIKCRNSKILLQDFYSKGRGRWESHCKACTSKTKKNSYKTKHKKIKQLSNRIDVNCLEVIYKNLDLQHLTDVFEKCIS